MPSWKDRLKPASFSGVLFHVRDSEDSGGRRAKLHEYPLRDLPFLEELGRVARRILVEGYLVGDDYATRRDQLRAKFETASPGFPRRPGRTLVLPTSAPVKVLCTSFRFRETLDEGRLVRFSAEFVEVGEELQPGATVAPAGAADVAAEAVTAEASASFEEGVVVAGVVERAREAVTEVVAETVARLRRLDVFSGPARDVARLEASLTGLANELSVLVSAPADLAARVLEALDAVLDAASTPLGALEAYRALFEFPPLEDPGPGLQGELTTENNRLTAELVALAAVAGAVRAAARADYETLEDAQEARADLSAELDTLAALAADAVLPALEELRAVLGRAVPPPDRDLPSLRTVTLAQTRPALEIAHELYQDAAGREAELVARNAVRHPLRVPGMVPLLVLSR